MRMRMRMRMRREEKEEEIKVEVINSWSAPRSLSTCLMYSFAQRDDTEVVDEPFYTHMLQVSGAGIERPYREELLSKMDIDGRKVLNEVIFSPGKKKYRYCKHMSNARLPGTADLMRSGKHFILLRSPLYVLQSYDKVAPPSFLELGYPDLVSIYSELCELGRPPPIVEASELQHDPERVIRHLCGDLGIPFQSSMLKWEAGPNPADGIWGPMWYKSLHKTTGFIPPRTYRKEFPLGLYDVLEQCLPFYNFLMREKSKQISHLEPPVPAYNKIFVWINNEILPSNFAKVSVDDSIFQGNGLVCEWLQIHNKKILNLDKHLDRSVFTICRSPSQNQQTELHWTNDGLIQSAKALAFECVPASQEIREAIFTTLITNGMYHNARVRVSLTHGKKSSTSGIISPGSDQCPYESTLIVRPEWKLPVSDCTKGLALVTAPTVKENNSASVDVIKLDENGFVSDTAAFSLFLVQKGHVIMMPPCDHCIPIIAREIVISLVTAEGLPVENRRISLSELHNADEAWIITSMDELKPIVEIDGHLVGNGSVGLITDKIRKGFNNLMEHSGVFIPTE